jgi:hypothetical protein
MVARVWEAVRDGRIGIYPYVLDFINKPFLLSLESSSVYEP